MEMNAVGTGSGQLAMLVLLLVGLFILSRHPRR